MKIIITIVITILVLFLVGLSVMYSGAVNVSVLTPSSGLAKKILFTTMRRSVERRAKRIEVPDLKNEATIRTGAEHYIEMCRGCHGAPGIEDSELSQGLDPRPPHLYWKDEGIYWSAAQQFWIVKNGIMWTGMPAWGVTHSDEKIWSIVAFLRTLPGMTADQYNQIYNSIESESEGHTRM